MKLALALTCILILAAISEAETVQRQVPVWRCGPDGRDLRDAPCPGAGAASAVSFDDPSPADRRAAQLRQQADARHADSLARDRLAREAQARRQRALILGPAAPQAPAAASAAPPPPAQPPRLARPHKPASAPKKNASAAAAGR